MQVPSSVMNTTAKENSWNMMATTNTCILLTIQSSLSHFVQLVTLMFITFLGCWSSLFNHVSSVHMYCWGEFCLLYMESAYNKVCVWGRCVNRAVRIFPNIVRQFIHYTLLFDPSHYFCKNTVCLMIDL